MPDLLINRLCLPLLTLGAAVLAFAVAWLSLGPDQVAVAAVLAHVAQLAGVSGLGLTGFVLWDAARQARA